MNKTTLSIIIFAMLLISLMGNTIPSFNNKDSNHNSNHTSSLLKINNEYRDDNLAPFGISKAITTYTGGPINTVVSCMAVDPENPDIIYAGTGDRVTLWGYPIPENFGICKSDDGGNNWTIKNNGLEDHEISCIVIDPSDSEKIFAGAYSGIYQSTDGGEHWIEGNIGARTITTIAINPENPQIIYAASGSIFKTVNGGETWIEKKEGLPTYGNQFLSLAIDPNQPETLYVGHLAGIHKTTDGAETWHNIGNSDLKSVSAIAVSPIDSQEIYVGLGNDPTHEYWGIYRTTNGGDLWQFCTHPKIADITSILYDSNDPNTIYAGTRTQWGSGAPEEYGAWGMGLWQTTDGHTWDIIEDIPPHANIASLEIAPTNPEIIYASALGGIYKTIDGGIHWIQLLDKEWPQGGRVVSIAAHPDEEIIYAGTVPSAIFKYEDEQWTIANKGISNLVSMNSLAIDPMNPNTVYAGGKNCMKASSDGGNSWYDISDESWPGFTVNCLAIHPENGLPLYSGMQNGIVYKYDGEEWQEFTTDLLSGGLINSLCVQTTDDSSSHIVFAGLTDCISQYECYGYIYRNTDGIWEQTCNGIENLFDLIVYSIAPGQNTTIYAGTNQGVYQSTNNGDLWENINEGISTNIIWDLTADINGIDPVLFAGTPDGLWQKKGETPWVYVELSEPNEWLKAVELGPLRNDPDLNKQIRTIYCGTWDHGVHSLKHVIDLIPFIRGDTNADNEVTLADAMYILHYLYLPDTPIPACMDSVDVNDDGYVDMSDAIYFLKYLYVPGTPPIPLPYPDCGTDPTEDELDCGYHPCMD